MLFFINLILFYLILLESVIEETYNSSPILPGVCYATNKYAVGRFDARGGVLQLSDCSSIQLIIPKDALTELQLVYFILLDDRLHSSDGTITQSPEIECGPDGLNFKVRATSTSSRKYHNWEEASSKDTAKFNL